MGSGKRSLTTTAMALACAATILSAPGVAFAAPTPTPTPTPPPPQSATPASTKDLEAVRKKLDTLYHDAAVATDAYNLAEERAEEQSTQIVGLARSIVEGQARLDGLKDRAGAAARAQYRGGGLPDEARLMLSDDPEQFLDGAGRIREGAQATKGLLAEMRRTQKEEKKRLAKLEQQAAYKAQSAWLGSGVLDEISGKASAQGKKAVEYATKQIGKAYEWGAEGPNTFDCSGLTSQAWAAAGQGIPRTSQEQWKQLDHIAVEAMRPGDLIIYNSDASHVALYIGDGAIIHAPRPGRTVTIAGAGSMPILGVVRPEQ